MNTLKVYLYYYLGNLCYYLGAKYVFVLPIYHLYQYFMEKSSDLDTDNKLWSEPNKE